MRCPACGADVVEQAVFCHKCGERLDSVPGEQTPSSPGDPPAVSSETTSQPASGAAPQRPTGPAQRPQTLAAPYGNAADEPESHLWQGAYSPRAMLGGWLIAGMITILLVVAAIWWQFASYVWIAVIVIILVSWLYVLILLAYRKITVRYELTTQRFVHQRGFLRRTTDRIEVIDIDDVTFTQGLLERLAGVGTIILLSSDRSNPKLTMRGIENVKHVADLIDNARRAERRRRGLHIEQI
jgi:membrane protein YdbS with pleckstrin-like domain